MSVAHNNSPFRVVLRFCHKNGTPIMIKNKLKITIILLNITLILFFTACNEPENPPLVVKTVMVSPAQDHGVVFKGEEGVLNYNITIWGENIFPVNLLNKNVTIRFFDTQGKEMPAVNGITLSRDTPNVTASGLPSSLKISVNVPDEGAYRLAIVLHGVESNKFTLNVTAKTPTDLMGTVTISGTADVGQTLTANIPGFPADKTPVFIWQKAQYGVQNPVYENIPNSNNSTYVVQETDRGYIIRVTVGADGIDGFIQSAPTAAVPLLLTGNVTITGNFYVGQTVTTNISELYGNGTPSFTWQRGTGTNFETITNAVSAAYLLQTADVGKVIRVIVKRTGSSGEVASEPTPVIVNSVGAQINDLRTMDTLPAKATITLFYSGEQIAPQLLFFNTRTIEITLKSNVQNGYLALSGNGAMFMVDYGVTLILQDIELRGRANNTSALVVVRDSALIMEMGAKISGNTNNESVNSNNMGGGVRVDTYGVFTMNGGEISGNKASSGAGVDNRISGNFRLNNGIITGNNAIDDGGGVKNAGNFEMLNGNISNNNADYGGGVDNRGVFNMYDGYITHNSVSIAGGGIINGGIFNMHNGEISDNNSTMDGGGVTNVNFDNAVIFNLYNGKISGNTVGRYGGGVHNLGSSRGNLVINMYGGEINSNFAATWGGGIANIAAIFRISNGVIYGTDIPAKSNNAPNGIALTNATSSGVAAISNYGIFDENDSFIELGTLINTNLTIQVVNGNLVSPPLLPSVIFLNQELSNDFLIEIPLPERKLSSERTLTERWKLY